MVNVSAQQDSSRLFNLTEPSLAPPALPVATLALLLLTGALTALLLTTESWVMMPLVIRSATVFLASPKTLTASVSNQTAQVTSSVQTAYQSSESASVSSALLLLKEFLSCPNKLAIAVMDSMTTMVSVLPARVDVLPAQLLPTAPSVLLQPILTTMVAADVLMASSSQSPLSGTADVAPTTPSHVSQTSRPYPASSTSNLSMELVPAQLVDLLMLLASASPASVDV